MMSRPWTVLTPACVMLFAGLSWAGDGWITYDERTAELVNPAIVGDDPLGRNDAEEKDYAWGDLDHDGDIDLVVVRKVIGTNPNGRRNVLLMNENGALVDRTLLYARVGDDGGQGFLDITPDRDVALVDVDGDGWLDIVTAPAGLDDPPLPKTISHPRLYMNLGAPEGSWLGFQYQEGRMPQLVEEPNFCGIGFGDVTGDGAPDLYFTDYNNELEDRLLVNDGAGFFTDETAARFPGNSTFLIAAFSPHAYIPREIAKARRRARQGVIAVHQMDRLLNRLTAGDALLRLLAGRGANVVIEGVGAPTSVLRNELCALPIVAPHDLIVIEEIDPLVLERCVQQFEAVGCAGAARIAAKRPRIPNRELYGLQRHANRARVAAFGIALRIDRAIAIERRPNGPVQIVERSGGAFVGDDLGDSMVHCGRPAT